MRALSLCRKYERCQKKEKERDVNNYENGAKELDVKGIYTKVALSRRELIVVVQMSGEGRGIGARGA